VCCRSCREREQNKIMKSSKLEMHGKYNRLW